MDENLFRKSATPSFTDIQQFMQNPLDGQPSILDISAKAKHIAAPLDSNKGFEQDFTSCAAHFHSHLKEQEQLNYFTTPRVSKRPSNICKIQKQLLNEMTDQEERS